MGIGKYFNSHTEFGKFNSACATLGTVAATIIYFKMSGGSKKVCLFLFSFLFKSSFEILIFKNHLFQLSETSSTSKALYYLVLDVQGQYLLYYLFLGL